MGSSPEADQSVTVTDLVHDGRDKRPRWAVSAVFVGVDGSEPRCIEYRVRVVPPADNATDALRAGHIVMGEMESDTSRPRPAIYRAAEVGAPPEGIPRRVFEVASQSRLLAKARRKVEKQPERYDNGTARLLARQERRRIGRPPVRSMGEKLAVLQSVEAAYAEGRTLDDVAANHLMSRSAVRDLVSWARRDASPPLFTSYGPGRRGGELTPAARRMLDENSAD